MSKYRDMAQAALPTQTERADARQTVNSAGGYVYEVDSANRLRRFLVLGTEGGTFYASERDLTKTNLDFMKALAVDDPGTFLSVLMEVDHGNLAPRHSTVLLALAVLFAHTKDDEVYAEIKLIAFHNMVRTGTHLFEFVDYVTMFRKWGRGLRTLIASWYTTKEAGPLAYQVVKYRQRGGWAHRDLLRKAHPKGTPEVNGVLDYVAHGLKAKSPVPSIIVQFEAAKAGEANVHETSLLTWEMLPTDTLTHPDTWATLVSGGRLPYTAMLRNLGRMTHLGTFDRPEILRDVVRAIKDPEQIKKARLHPFNALTALKTYQSGHGFKGSLTWAPKRQIVDALDAAFYASFGALEPTGARTLIGLDVSQSMGSPLMGSNVTAAEGATAMAMASLAVDPDTTDMVAFTSARMWGDTTLTELDLSPRQRLDDIIRRTRAMTFGRTDCALPLLWAEEKRKFYDAFVVYTDNETWAGKVQVPEALRRYRSAINPQARMIVVGMTATGFTIADPQDPLSLDLVGFDSSAPRVISDFTAGRF